MRALIVILLVAVAVSGVAMLGLDGAESPSPEPQKPGVDGATPKVGGISPQADVAKSDTGSRVVVGGAPPVGGGDARASEGALIVLDSSGSPVQGLPVLGPDSGHGGRPSEFAAVWASLFAAAPKTDVNGEWSQQRGMKASPGTYAVLVAPHLCVLAPVDHGRKLVLPEMHELSIVPSGFGEGEHWRCSVQPDYGQHHFAEITLAGGVRVLLRELAVRGGAEMQSFTIGPKNSEWSLDATGSRVLASVSQRRVTLPASVQLSKVWQDDRATLSVVDANRNPVSAAGVVRIAKEPDQPVATIAIDDGKVAFEDGMFSRGDRYVLDVVLATGEVAGPVRYDPARDSSRIVAVVDADGPRVLRVACDAEAPVASVVVESGGGFSSISKMEHSSVGGAWFEQRPAGVVALCLPKSYASARVVWLVSEQGEVSTAPLEPSGGQITATAEGVSKVSLTPGTFGFEAWPKKGLVGLEVELVGAISGQREVVAVKAVLTSQVKAEFGPFFRLTGARAQSFGLLKPRGGKRLRIHLVE